MKPRPGLSLPVIVALTVFAFPWLSAQQSGTASPWPEIKSYEEMKIPADNPMSVAKVELGRQLYYDQRLSGDQTRSCYSCHVAEKGLTDGLPKAIGAYGAPLPRSAPTMWNLGYHKEFYWDGRSPTLEAQAKAAWAGGNMGAAGKDGKPSVGEVCTRLMQIAGYRRQFQEVFGGGCTPDNAAKALAAFMRTIVANHTNAAWVRFREGDNKALSPQARRGWQVFSEVAKCTNCHDGVLLTDLQFHTVGIGWDENKKEFADVGRFKVTNDEKHKGAFKTPTLLDISESAPYFHDGSVATLEEAVDLMLGGGIKNPVGDPNLEPRKLTPKQKADLLAFLRALKADYRITQPQLPK
ncbi:MAG: c-type cytochrome [Acidobacteria bacterium]|nr:c-type cytochrome [Acidobacteriota bacterium]